MLALFRANLLVFQQLDILYLGGNYVRAVCEKVWRFEVCKHLEWFSRLVTRQNATRVKNVGSWRVMIAGALQNKNGQPSLAVNSRLIPVASESPECPVLQKKWLFTFLMYPTINTFIPTKCRVLQERILREKTKIDSSTILDIWFSKFLYSHPLH